MTNKYPVFIPTVGTTPQQVFDAVVAHLAAQGGPSMSGAACTNRTSDGRACAAACLLTDAEASLDFEGASNVSWQAMPDSLRPARLRPFARLLAELQKVHDRSARDRSATLASVRERLSRLAALHNLTFDSSTITRWE